MDVRVLGPLEVRSAGATVPIGSRMQRRLLTLLLIADGTPLRSERVIDVLWSGTPPPSAAGGLHTYVSRLRARLGDRAVLRSDEHGYRLVLDEDAVDADRFVRLVAAARARLPDEPEAAATDLAVALSLWRGPAYAEFATESFARPEAVRLDELRRAATEDAFEARLAAGHGDTVPDLEAFTVAHPLRERAHLQLMTALGRAGRPTEALEVYQRLRRRLADELGLDPSPALRQVQSDILRQVPGVTANPSARSDRSLEGRVSNHLPRPVTTLVGRERETDAVCRLLETERLVTLAGVGGVGKTRLALRAATAVAAGRPDGVWWCELAPTDADGVGHTIAAVLGVRQQADRTIADSLVATLADKHLLLVLDNCEHVVQASAELVERILRRCPQVQLLTTSREPLAVEGEQVWQVPPLGVAPDAAEVDGASAPSTRLFLERATSHRADFADGVVDTAAIVDICRQLDGLPLAIELAAALVPALEPAEIASRLGERFGLLTHGRRTDPRHRDLAAVVAWSYELLDPEERHLFERLSVFAGGFTLAAAEAVCSDARVPADRVAGLLANLVNRSMVEVDRTTEPIRFRLLETLRQYATGHLDERGETSILQAAHAAWFVDLAVRTDAEVRGPDEAGAVEQLEAELANLRTAHRWAVELGDAGLALRLTSSLHVFANWRLRDEIFAWAEEAADLPAAVEHPLRPTVWGVAARGLSNRGELTRAREVAERALAAVPAETDRRRFVALDSLAAAALYEGRLDDCREHARLALVAVERGGDDYERSMARLHDGLALVYAQHPDAHDAARRHRAAADLLGNPSQRGWSLYLQAEACGDEEPEVALALLDAALSLAEPVHNQLLLGVAKVALASLRARHHAPLDALPAFAEVIRHWRRAGDWTHQWTTVRNLIPLLVRLQADEASTLLYGAQRTDPANPSYGAEAARLDEAATALRSRSDARTHATLVERGRALGRDRAIDLALSTIDELVRSRPERSEA